MPEEPPEDEEWSYRVTLNEDDLRRALEELVAIELMRSRANRERSYFDRGTAIVLISISLIVAIFLSAIAASAIVTDGLTTDLLMELMTAAAAWICTFVFWKRSLLWPSRWKSDNALSRLFVRMGERFASHSSWRFWAWEARNLWGKLPLVLVYRLRQTGIVAAPDHENHDAVNFDAVDSVTMGNTVCCLWRKGSSACDVLFLGAKTNQDSLASHLASAGIRLHRISASDLATLEEQDSAERRLFERSRLLGADLRRSKGDASEREVGDSRKPYQFSLAQLIGLVTWLTVSLGAAPLLWNRIVHVGPAGVELKADPYTLLLAILWFGLLGALIAGSRGFRWAVGFGMAVIGCAVLCLLILLVLWLVIVFA